MKDLTLPDLLLGHLTQVQVCQKDSHMITTATIPVNAQLQLL